MAHTKRQQAISVLPMPSAIKPASGTTDPLVSVIVLNIDRPDLTASCIAALRMHCGDLPVEIIVVDNASSDQAFAEGMAQILPHAELIRLPIRRSFGEANNIAVERARGQYIVFLNNDARVTAGWLPPLLETIAAAPDIGAVAPKLIFPDGRLQEVGGRMDSEGRAIQFGKVAPPVPADLSLPRDVDYCSAACLMMQRDVFERLGGFSQHYEPAYYEDVDLAMRLLATGHRIVCDPRATVIHLQNATSATPLLFGRSALADITEINRLKFLAQWGTALTDAGVDRSKLAAVTLRPAGTGLSPVPKREASQRTIAIVLPEPLNPSGLLHTMLAVAGVASGIGRCLLVTEAPVSAVRIEGLMAGLDLPSAQFELVSMGDLQRHGRVDVAVVASNSEFPTVLPAAGRVVQLVGSLLEISPKGLAERFALHADQLVVFSTDMSQALAERRAQWRNPPLPILEVPAPSLRPWPARTRTLPNPGETLSILSIARMTSESRHGFDLLIEAARNLVEMGVNFTLDCAGVVEPSDSGRAIFGELIERAKGLPVRFHPDATSENLAKLVEHAVFYWKGWGVGDAKRLKPSLSLLEVMTAGLVPLGDAQAMRKVGLDDHHCVHSFVDLAERTRQWITDEAERTRLSSLSRQMQAIAVNTASSGAFEQSWIRILTEPASQSNPDIAKRPA